MKQKVFTLEKFFFYIFLFFFIFPTNLNAETISTDITVSADTDPAGTRKTITEDLTKHGFTLGKEYEILQVPNIVDITYGRDVGYSITLERLPDEIENISATKIRELWKKEKLEMS